MKYMFSTVCFLLCISCTVNVAKPAVTKEDFNKSIEALRQTQVKVANLTKRVDELEKSNANLVSKVNSLQTLGSTNNKSRAVPVQPIAYSIPQVPHWTVKERTMIQNLIARFENNNDKKMANHELVGNKFPFLRFVNSNGEVIDLRQHVANKKLVVVVLRGFAGSVCLVCSSQTLALSKQIKKFHDRNTEVILVYPGEIETIPQFISSVHDIESTLPLPFPIVLDADLSLVNEFKINGSLAKPSTMIIDENGIVRYAYVGKHPGDRPTIPNLLKVIDDIK